MYWFLLVLLYKHHGTVPALFYLPRPISQSVWLHRLVYELRFDEVMIVQSDERGNLAHWLMLNLLYSVAVQFNLSQSISQPAQLHHRLVYEFWFDEAMVVQVDEKWTLVHSLLLLLYLFYGIPIRFCLNLEASLYHGLVHKFLFDQAVVIQVVENRYLVHLLLSTAIAAFAPECPRLVLSVSVYKPACITASLSCLWVLVWWGRGHTSWRDVKEGSCWGCWLILGHRIPGWRGRKLEAADSHRWNCKQYGG